jgi:hypothetical protein
MRLYESLYIFLRYTQDIQYLIEFMIDLGYRERKQNEWNLKDQAHYVALYNTILMNTCSFLDEYNLNFLSKSEPELSKRILQVKKIAKPAFKKLNEWKNLKQYRNHMIAHNFRIVGDKFSLNMLGQYNAPRTYRDLTLLRKHLAMINAVIIAEFESEIPHINTFVDSFPVKPQEINYDNIEEELTTVVDEINKLCLENDKNYQLPLQYFKDL